MQPVRYECLYRKQSGVYGREYQLLRLSGIECLYRKQSEVYRREYQLLQPLGMSARIRISLDVLAENHLPALPISPAGS